MSIIGLIYFVIALGIIVLVHEWGHLIVAKRNNVFCHEFSIGMGPKIVTFYKDKTGTVYNIRAIPLGGYVHMAGEDTGFEADEKIAKDLKFDGKKKWTKFRILVAGATMNFILGICLFFVIGFFGGTPDLNTNQVKIIQSGTTQEGEEYEMPLYQAGLRTGDKILLINDTEVNAYNDITKILENSSDEVTIKYYDESKEEEVSTIVTKTETGYVGVSPFMAPYHLFSSIKYGFTQFFVMIFEVFYSFYLLTTPDYSVADLSGPVGIAIASNGVVHMGLLSALTWIAFLSINIGIVNLLPIPALDGGRILFLIIEFFRKKPLNPKTETLINNGVFIGLLVLLVFVTLHDILNIQELLDMFN